VKAAPDGYTLLVVDAAPAINTTLYHNLNFVFLRDIAPVACVINTPLFMVVNPAVPAKTVPEFIAYAKANPRKVNMASNGNGALLHLAGELFKMMTDVDLVHVPYRGAQPALTDRQSARIGSNHCDALGGRAGYLSLERVPAGLRRGCMERRRRTQENTP
jgi:tripartite-type tricarboxylate transporter receptor subunit TctC